MDPSVIGALVNAGIGGIGLYLFVRGVILAKPVVDELLAERDRRIVDLKADRDGWRRLALGTERRLDRATPIIASAVGAPVSSEPFDTEASS